MAFKSQIVKIKGKLYKVLGLSPIQFNPITGQIDAQIYTVVPLKPTPDLHPMFERALADESEFEELSPVEKLLYGN